MGVGRWAFGRAWRIPTMRHAICDDSAGQRLRTTRRRFGRHQKPAGSPVRWVTVTGTGALLGSRRAVRARRRGPVRRALAAARLARAARYFRPAPAIAGDLAGVPLVSSGDTPIMRMSSDWSWLARSTSSSATVLLM